MFLGANGFAPLDQPDDADEIVAPNQRPLQIGIVRRPGMARPMRHVDMGDRMALCGKQGRQVAMHVVEIGKSQKGLTPERLQTAAGVSRGIGEDADANRIGNP